MRYALALSSLSLALLLTGCVHALHPYNSPSQQRLHVHAKSPERYVVRVADSQDYPVAADGRVTFDIPRLPRGCAVYLSEWLRLADSKSEDVRAIQLLSEGTVVRKF